jgi:hypothetical protein
MDREVLRYHSIASQALNIAIADSQKIGENLIRVLTKCRRSHADTRFRIRELHGRIYDLDWSASRMVDLLDHVSGAHCRLSIHIQVGI